MNNIKLIESDFDHIESKFFIELTHLLNEKGFKNLKLNNIFAYAFGKVYLPSHIKDLIHQTDFAKSYGMNAVITLFNKRINQHLTHANGIKFPEQVILMTCISSVTINPKEIIRSIPGDKYHQDGKGNPLSTKITLITEKGRNWNGGELHFLPFDRNVIQKSPVAYPGATYLLNSNQAIVFDNKQLIHAVNPNLQANTRTERIIYQERTNHPANFNYGLLSEFNFKWEIPKPVSLLPLALSIYINPTPQSIRYKSTHQYTQIEKNYINQFQTPDKTFRDEMKEILGDEFINAVKLFEKDGVLILPEYISKNNMKELKHFFNKSIENKKVDPFYKQATFNGAISNECNLTESPIMSELLTDPLLLAITGYYFGAPPMVSWFRGYKLEPTAPLKYRAWEPHQDQKRQEIKVMILNSTVEENGQAMRYLVGTHRHWWNVRTQKDTKFEIDEAYKLSDGNILKYTGNPGTLACFHTNGIHYGFRNHSVNREVITINYKINHSEEARFPIQNLDPIVTEKIKSSYRENAVKQITSNNNKALFIEMKKENKTTIIETIKGFAKNENYYTNAEKELETVRKTPTLEDVKFRFFHKKNNKNFLFQVAKIDLGCDLDLPVRFGNGDVDRDIQFAKFRDLGPNSSLSKRLKDRLKNVKPNFECLLLVDSLVTLAKEISSIANTIENNQEAYRCSKLADDLALAFTYCDSVQRLRTTVLQLYNVYDCIHEIKPSKQLMTSIDNLLNTYCQIVMIDDLTTLYYKKSDINYASLQKNGIFQRHSKEPYSIDPNHHVRIWISKDGMPNKQKLRLLTFKKVNPDSKITLIYADDYLTSKARKDTRDFCNTHDISLLDVKSIECANDTEKQLMTYIHHEVDCFFKKDKKEEKGNLGLVSDTLRLFEAVLEKGIYADFDVNFQQPMPNNKISLPLGVLARLKGSDHTLTASNDVIAGNPKHKVFKDAKTRLLSYYRKRGKSVKQYPTDLWQDKVGFGPNAWIYALDKNGINTGYNLKKLINGYISKDQWIYEDTENTIEKTGDIFSVLGPNKQLYPNTMGKLTTNWDNIPTQARYFCTSIDAITNIN